jgi:hypothetical protein
LAREATGVKIDVNLSYKLSLRTGTIRILSFRLTPLTRFTMTLGTKMEKYHGVQCRSCGETISVPARLANKRVLPESGDSGAGDEAGFPTLNLRCRICEKENFYKMSDIREIDETAGSSAIRERPSATRLRPQAKLSKAAKA